MVFDRQLHLKQRENECAVYFIPLMSGWPVLVDEEVAASSVEGWLGYSCGLGVFLLLFFGCSSISSHLSVRLLLFFLLPSSEASEAGRSVAPVGRRSSGKKRQNVNWHHWHVWIIAYIQNWEKQILNFPSLEFICETKRKWISLVCVSYFWCHCGQCFLVRRGRPHLEKHCVEFFCFSSLVSPPSLHASLYTYCSSLFLFYEQRQKLGVQSAHVYVDLLLRRDKMWIVWIITWIQILEKQWGIKPELYTLGSRLHVYGDYLLWWVGGWLPWRCWVRHCLRRDLKTVCSPGRDSGLSCSSYLQFAAPPQSYPSSLRSLSDHPICGLWAGGCCCQCGGLRKNKSTVACGEYRAS